MNTRIIVGLTAVIASAMLTGCASTKSSLVEYGAAQGVLHFEKYCAPGSAIPRQIMTTETELPLPARPYDGGTCR